MRRLSIVLIGLLVLLSAAFFWLRNPSISQAALVSKYGMPPSAFIELPDGMIAHFRDRGPRDGQVLLLVHGSSASLYTWEPWVALLSDKYRVISVDLPGHGLTSLPSGHDYSNTAYDTFIQSFVAALSLEQFVFAGNSMGGGIAWRYSLDHPEQVSHLVLLDASGVPSEDDSDPALIYSLVKIPGVNKVFHHVLPPFMVRGALESAIADDTLVTDEMVTLNYELLVREGRREASVVRMNTPWEASPHERLSEITQPTLILWGQEDTFVPVASGHTFDAQIPNSQLIIYNGVGHIPMEEVPEQSAIHLRTFLEAH